MTPRPLARAAARQAAAAALVLCACAAGWGAAGCSRPKKKMPDLALQTLAGDRAASLATCPTVKCLTVYITPWCGSCRKQTPMFLKVPAFLKAKGVETRFVVGMAKLDEVKAYAQEFGPATLLDPDGLFRVAGVPHFFVSNSTGDALNQVAGVPGFVQNEKALAWYLGL